MPTISQLLKETKSLANPIRAKNLSWFFKTGKGDYAEGDKFLGLTVPISRTIAKKYTSLVWPELTKLIQSKYHEERLIALLILIEKFSQTIKPISQERSLKNLSKGESFRRLISSEQTKIYKFYLGHTKWINNWDLVDLSAPKIVGAYLFSQSQNRKPSDKYPVLFKLVKSKNLWERRIAIVTTIYFIKQHEYQPTLDLAEILLKDKHNLIHKSVGWMLREVGKESITSLTTFIKKHYKAMPRTMLRYAIEKFPEEIRQAYLRGDI